MLKHAANLSDSHEYFLLWLGDVNARPWGARSDAYTLFPQLELSPDGVDLTADMSGGSHTASSTTTFTATLSSGALRKNEWAGATFRLSPSGGNPGYGTIVSHTAATGGVFTFSVTVTWSTGLTGGTGSSTASAYIVNENRKWGSYPQVRVLTPYQPVADSATDADVTPIVDTVGGRTDALPAPYSALSVTSFDDAGLLLPLSMHEGIAGFGISDAGSAHPIVGVSGSGTIFSFSTALAADDLLNGGYLIIDHDNSGVITRSWGQITDSTTVTITVSWLEGTGPGDNNEADIDRYMAWVPHYSDSPYAYLPGEGYSYPNHDPQPYSGSTIGAQVQNSARSVAASYGTTFGAMLVTAMRLSAAIGKRVNVVNLAANDSTLAPAVGPNDAGFAGKVGWYDHESHGSWDPASSTSLYARLEHLLDTVLPNAMTAEGNAKTLRCLGMVFVHGETDAVSLHARQNYALAQRHFVDSVRRLLDTMSYNPYGNGAKVPYVQPRVPVLPYCIDGSYARHLDRGGDSVSYDADEGGLVNSAIEESTGGDEFASSVLVDDLPRLTSDPGIYSAIGAAVLGARAGDRLVGLVNHGLGYGSTAAAVTSSRILDICNLALAHIGDAGQITSLTDGSEQAQLCLRFWPEARDELLQTRQWSFALRRRPLVPITKHEAGLRQNWGYCYVLPGEALFAFNVLPPPDEVGNSDFDYTDVLSSSYETTFVANDGSFRTLNDPSLRVGAAGSSGPNAGVAMDALQELPIVTESDLNPQPYSVEQSPFGGRYIFTNQPQATLQYVARVVDAELYSPLFASALSSALAAKLASVLVKGDKGEKLSLRLLQRTGAYVRSAGSSDANQQKPIRSQEPFGFVPDHLRHRT